MAINEYSDTVLDSINKAHNEIMFLYSMLNDKHDELTRLSGDIDKKHHQDSEAPSSLFLQTLQRGLKNVLAVQKARRT